MLREDKLNAALKTTSAYISSIAGNLEPLAKVRVFDFVFSNADEGTLSLDPEDADKYRQCLHALWEAVSPNEQISLRAVERVFQAAIFEALDIQKKRNADFNVRLEQALRDLRLRLTAPPQRFLVFCPVTGLEPAGLPSRVGKVEFAVFGDEHLDKLREAAASHNVDPVQHRIRNEEVEKLRQEECLFGRVTGAVEVEAIERLAAESLAIRYLRLVIDVINFYSDLIPYNHAHLSLPADAGAARVVIPQLVVEGTQQTSISINHTRWGRIGELSLTKLWELDSRRNLGFSRLAKLLIGPRNDLEEKIIASIQWAGRATAETRKEEAFLLYAIALESMVLADTNPIELTYRLRVRTAHLLADQIEPRRDLFSKLGHLYSIRSKIVHSGRYQVTDTDLAMLRNITKAALIRVCTGAEFLAMRTVKELREWFQDRVLH